MKKERREDYIRLNGEGKILNVPARLTKNGMMLTRKSTFALTLSTPKGGRFLIHRSELAHTQWFE
jgi:hypothetical protein